MVLTKSAQACPATGSCLIIDTTEISAAEKNFKKTPSSTRLDETALFSTEKWNGPSLSDSHIAMFSARGPRDPRKEGVSEVHTLAASVGDKEKSSDRVD